MMNTFERAALRFGDAVLDPLRGSEQPPRNTKKERSDIGQFGHILICSGAVLAGTGITLEAIPITNGVASEIALLAGLGVVAIGSIVKLTD